MNAPPASPEHTTESGNSRSVRPRLWPWFATGFALVFVGMLELFKIHSMLPSGRAVVALPLRRFYLVELWRVVEPNQALGPASGNLSALLSIAIEHVVLSCVGGLIALGIGLVLRKIKGRATVA